MSEFSSFDALCSTLDGHEFDRPPALVANAHITGLGVARALAAHDVPVVALDRSGDGVAPASTAVTAAGRVTYPLDDREAFREDVEELVDRIGREAVAFGCMDEWVNAFAETRPDGVHLSFDADAAPTVLDKQELYASAERLGVPFPETYALDGVDPDEAADALGFPLVVKPARKREGEEVLGTNVVDVPDREAFDETVAAARDADIRVLAQEKVDVAVGEDRSLASYVPPRAATGERADPLAVVGNARVRHPRAFGTSCVVDVVEDATIREQALSMLTDAEYHGISESEFVYDTERGEHVLLDVNTRPWKWIGLPVAAGRNLPLAAYETAVGGEIDRARGPERASRWVYLRDFFAGLAGGETPNLLTGDQWRAIAGGRPADAGVTTGVFDSTDPGPTGRLLETEFSAREYYCSC
ncbi:carboxylate--amine ligase [Halomarina oriensis]|uniref:Carboxylate--amine ligase n=1 Tax=Halomarina oriensis TaxID=671145 RepID=A0A6B0GQE3_9EURY|nr:carboxylate--amine ligase [Halomarina oriensis]MWG36890.1 carboxylate--amine ligase [Halomarina oriensis]